MCERYASVRFDTEFDLVHSGIVHRAGGEADRPSVGEFGGKGEAGTATCAVAHNGDQGAFFHIAYERIGGTITRTVGQHDGFLLPTYAFRRFDVFGFGGRKIIVSRSGFMGDVAYQSCLVGETEGQKMGLG